MSQPNEPIPTLRMTVGVPVYSADEQKLGKVKAIQGSAFQVETGLFQKDYWLSGETVVEAVPDQPVMLGIEKSDLDAHKLDDQTLAA